MSPTGRVQLVVRGVRTLVPRLPSAVWILELGALTNSLGTGFVLPFSVIYFHNIRGFSFGEAAAVVAVISALGIITGPLAGTAVDRWSPRACLAVSLALMAAGYVGFPFVRAPWQAFLLAVLAGAGNGSFYPSQASLLGGLTRPEQRHVAFSLQRVMTNLGYGVGGLIGGFVATTSNPASFNILFFVDAGTFVAFIAVLAVVADPSAPQPHPAARGRYRDVRRDRTFLGLLAVNALFVTAGYSLFETLVPAYAKNFSSVSDKLIGAFFLVNTAFIVVAQLPITRLIEGRRRMRMLALLGVLWALALLVVLVGARAGTLAGAVFILAFLIFSAGECLQSAILSPTAADLAPPQLLGRYMALTSFTWQLGLAIGPAAGGFVLTASSSAVWIISAALCLTGSIGALMLDSRVAEEVRYTPRSQPVRPTLKPTSQRPTATERTPS